MGLTRGKVPRHAKVYADFAAEHDRLQALRIVAMQHFVTDVHEGDDPTPQHLVECEADVVDTFRNWLDRACRAGSDQ